MWNFNPKESCLVHSSHVVSEMELAIFPCACSSGIRPLMTTPPFTCEKETEIIHLGGGSLLPPVGENRLEEERYKVPKSDRTFITV